MTPPLDGRVRVFAGEPPRVVGAGIQLTADHVLSCWHVAGGDGTPLAVEPPSAVGDPVACDVVWAKEIGPRGDGDLALLRTARPLRAVPARLADHGDADLDVRIVGYPSPTPAHVVVHARLTGPHDPVTGWRQLDRVSAATAALDRGFSGAGVFDADGYVVGMVVARVVLGQQVVGWMLPVRQWRELLPPGLAMLSQAAATATAALSLQDKLALAGLLADIDVFADPHARQLLLQSLPSSLRLGFRGYGQLRLDSLSMVRLALDTSDGMRALYGALLLLAGPDSLPLREFRALATTLRVLPPDPADR